MNSDVGPYKRLANAIILSGINAYFTWRSTLAISLRKLRYENKPLNSRNMNMTFLDVALGPDPATFLFNDSCIHDLADIDPEKIKKHINNPVRIKVLMDTLSAHYSGANK